MEGVCFEVVIVGVILKVVGLCGCTYLIILHKRIRHDTAVWNQS